MREEHALGPVQCSVGGSLLKIISSIAMPCGAQECKTPSHQNQVNKGSPLGSSHKNHGNQT